MAKRRWKVLPGGGIKRWKASTTSEGWGGVPPRWHRNQLNRSERRARQRLIRLATGTGHGRVLDVIPLKGFLVGVAGYEPRMNDRAEPKGAELRRWRCVS